MTNRGYLGTIEGYLNPTGYINKFVETEARTMDGLISMPQRTTSVSRFLALAVLVLLAGCKLGEGNISDRLPKGQLIPIDQIPEVVMPDAKRQALPDGTTVEHCDGEIYRFNYPNGQIWFRNSKGEDCGGLI